MKKVFFLISFIFVCRYSIAQLCNCNADVLKKRAYFHPSSNQEKILSIMITNIMIKFTFDSVGEIVNKASAEMKQSFQNGEKADITPYIEKIRSYRNSELSIKQLKETNQLDADVYCFYTYLIMRYEEVKKIINQNSVDKSGKKIMYFIDNTEPENERRLNKIYAEIQSLERQYHLYK